MNARNHPRRPSGANASGRRFDESSSRRHRRIRALAWFLALLAALAAAVLAFSAGQRELTPQEYQPDEELYGALRLQPDRGHGESVYHRHCAACHSRSAWGSASGETPSLAGQHYQYLVKQIADLRRGGDRTAAPFHRRAARVLAGTQQIADVSAHLMTLPANPDPRRGAGDSLRLGGELYDGLCRGCHQDSGEGHAAFFIPSLVGQHYPYLLRQLEEFAAGHRRNAPPELIELATALSAEQKAAVADYISRLGQLGTAKFEKTPG